jgi:hypothetical protein
MTIHSKLVMRGDKIIPRHESEVVETIARKQWRGDDEKVARTSVDVVIAAGVEIRSRYGKADELDTMATMVYQLSPGLSGHIKSLFCNSKYGHSYSVVLREWNEDGAWIIAHELEIAAMDVYGGHGGHGGITVAGPDRNDTLGNKRAIDIDPNWNDVP